MELEQKGRQNVNRYQPFEASQSYYMTDVYTSKTCLFYKECLCMHICICMFTILSTSKCHVNFKILCHDATVFSRLGKALFFLTGLGF